MTLPTSIGTIGTYTNVFRAMDGYKAVPTFGPTRVYADNLEEAKSLVEKYWPGFMQNENLYWWSSLHNGAALMHDPLNAEPYVAVLLDHGSPTETHYIRGGSPVPGTYVRDIDRYEWTARNLFGVADKTYEDGKLVTTSLHDAIKFATLFPPMDYMRMTHECSERRDTASDWTSGYSSLRHCYPCWYMSAQNAFHQWIDSDGAVKQQVQSIRHLVQHRYGMT